jgi:hypothetical protein
LDYGFTLGALALKPSDLCSIRVKAPEPRKTNLYFHENLTDIKEEMPCPTAVKNL